MEAGEAMKNMDWKDFEALAARIERVLAPIGAIVKTNDRIRDLVTGRMRQVDASIRYKIGTVPILVSVECRKRKHRSDDTWIEQIALKRQKIGADKTIAVSVAPFSAEAVITASRFNIEVRQLSEISEGEIRGWLSITAVQHNEFCLNLRSEHPELYQQEGQGAVPVTSELVPDGADLRRDHLYTLPNGKMLTVLRIFEAFANPKLLSCIKRPTIDLPTEAEVRLRFERGLVRFLARDGVRDVASILFKVQACLESCTTSPVDRIHKYSTPAGALVSVAESHAEIGGNKVVVAFHKEDGSGEYATSVHIDTVKPQTVKKNARGHEAKSRAPR
jgi:hypothetical protein